MTELYNLINAVSEQKIVVFILSATLGYLLNFFICLAGFKWANSINQKILFLIMPAAMTVISWTIAGNLGLSLGMIGALSIVRFRTPVKSPLELTIYFVLIVIGISITVAPVYTVLIFLLTIASPFAFKLLLNVKSDNLDFTDTYMNSEPVANFLVNAKSEAIVQIISDEKIILINMVQNQENLIEFSCKIKDLTELERLKNLIEKCGKIERSEFTS
ncbi:DUF4956 domain-containing protein [Candidatus Pelagibacter sp.]|jgi:hypothetical protein|nr:DUF4956 domain-containing protein [Candidatus Pelagibacter sp.]|tara:strand:+ start:797 stop:1447 length:651 start_codon:yes stop_codon:yes gene_type:complete